MLSKNKEKSNIIQLALHSSDLRRRINARIISTDLIRKEDGLYFNARAIKSGIVYSSSLEVKAEIHKISLWPPLLFRGAILSGWMEQNYWDVRKKTIYTDG